MTRIQVLISYIFLINLITFLVRGIDKYKSRAKKRRVSEKNLLIFTAFGGRLGAILGMQAFRHKTVKGKFLTRFRIIAGAWLIVSVVLLFVL